ncbi:ArsR family transcriptional regulator [Alicyclobacillaceae bacterium I2511]|nr:ArsR family transcriptional regulator [Alicyclobacillaceae bacterium I2511]
MPVKNIEADEQQLECLFALADRHRCKIMEVLSEGEHCVCELTQILGIRQNTLSHHLKVLREQELILTRKKPSDHRWIYYRLNPAMLHKAAQMIDNWAICAEMVAVRTPVCPEGEPEDVHQNHESRCELNR